MVYIVTQQLLRQKLNAILPFLPFMKVILTGLRSGNGDDHLTSDCSFLTLSMLLRLCREHDIAALLSSFEMLALSANGAGFNNVAEVVIQSVAYEMPWLKMEHIQEWCNMRFQGCSLGTVKQSGIAAIHPQTSCA